MSWRTPSLKEIAYAFRYLDHEYYLKGDIDGEMWAEGLAFGVPDRRDRQPRPDSGLTDYDVQVAREVFPQLTEQQWRALAARADYLRGEQEEDPRYARER